MVLLVLIVMKPFDVHLLSVAFSFVYMDYLTCSLWQNLFVYLNEEDSFLFILSSRRLFSMYCALDCS